jgi:hypothetical protein
MGLSTYTSEGSFTGYDLGDLRALLLRMLRVTNTVRFSPTAGTADYDWIDDCINRGQDDFVRMTKCLRNFAIVELVANRRTYRLPDDWLDVSAAYYYTKAEEYGYKQLFNNSIAELNDDIAGWRTDTGTPERFYVDRNYGQGQTFGLYPIPNVDGDSLVFSSDYGVVVQWVCPLYTFNQDVGTIIRFTGADEFILTATTGGVVDATATEGNLLLEYFRLPKELIEYGTDHTQITEVPKEYQKSLCYYAAADLLSDQPEDSAEYKRSQYYRGLYDREVATYVNRQKRPLSAHQLRAKPAVWGWQKNMTYYKEMA